MSDPADPVVLRPLVESDLRVFFDQQLDAESNRMAAFAAKDPADRERFLAHWNRLMADPSVVIRTILSGRRVAGYAASFLRGGEREVCYWLGREFWDRGIATRALRSFLELVAERPLHARAAADNVASVRVLEKCGFRRCGAGRGFSHVRGEEVDEVVLVLRPEDGDTTDTAPGKT